MAIHLTISVVRLLFHILQSLVVSAQHQTNLVHQRTCRTQSFLLLNNEHCVWSCLLFCRAWLSSVHQSLIHRYRKNIRSLFIFNSSVWLQTAVAYVIPPTKKAWQTKIHFMNDLSELHQFIVPSQLSINPELIKPPSGPISFFKKLF